MLTIESTTVINYILKVFNTAKDYFIKDLVGICEKWLSGENEFTSLI